MTEIKRLDQSHHNDFLKINNTILKTLTNTEWYIPMSEYNAQHIFDDGSTIVVYGAIIDGVLAGVTLIDLDKAEYSDLCDAIGIPEDKKGGELGACMVLPDYRGQNLMYLMNTELIKAAHEMGLDYLVASAHPDNIASNSSLRKIGFECKAQLTRCGHYIRNAYYLEV